MTEPVSRRGFLKGSLAGSAIVGMGGISAFGAPIENGGTSMASRYDSQTPKGEISHRLLFFEAPNEAYGIHHAYAPVTKVECRVDDGGLGWSCIDFGDPIEIGGTYRCYGTVRTPDEKFMGIALWESNDALEWTPVTLGQVKRDGKETNLIEFENLPGDQTAVSLPNVIRLNDGRMRMYFWKHRDGHLRYLIAESEDGRRWRVLDVDKPALFHPHDGGLWKLAEGLSRHEAPEIKLTPEEFLRRKRLWSNDSTHIHYNPQLDRFECYSVWLHPAIPDRRVDVDNAPGIHRLIHRRFSADGLEWSDAELIIMPDDGDPWDLQFYFLSVHRQADWMIGRVGYYRVADGMQTTDTDLCFSRDGRNWERPVRGGWIPRSNEGLDTMGIYAAGALVDRGDRWLTLYSGTPVPHNNGRYRSGVMGATFAKNRFVGLEADRTRGGFMTEPFFPAGETIRLDADIRGSLRAELCDAFGRKLEGFHLMDSTPIQGDSEAHILRWKEASTADHRFECLRLRFEYTDGVVYGVDFSAG